MLASPPRLLVHGVVRRGSPVRVPLFAACLVLARAYVMVLALPRYLRGNVFVYSRGELLGCCEE